MRVDINPVSFLVISFYLIKSHINYISHRLVALKVALDTSSKVTIIANRYNGVITAASTPTAELVGVTHPMQDANNTITDAYYFWLQTHGLASVVCDDVSGLDTIGQPAYLRIGSTAGNVNAINAGASSAVGTTLTDTIVNDNFLIGYVIDAPGGADADAAILRLVF